MIIGLYLLYSRNRKAKSTELSRLIHCLYMGHILTRNGQFYLFPVAPFINSSSFYTAFQNITLKRTCSVSKLFFINYEVEANGFLTGEFA